MTDESKVALIIPTLNAGDLWCEVLEAIDKQTFQPGLKILLDSCSGDETVTRAKQHGFVVHKIDPADFNHGLTRQYGAKLATDADVLVYMTQDSVLGTPNALEGLVLAFDNPAVAATYGRQDPRFDANAAERIMRTFNYPTKSRLKTKKDIPELGIHAAFCSDSFSAYRKSDLIEAGGFPATSFGEDMLMAAQLVLADKSVFYNADALVMHSHNDTLISAFKRGRAIGELHRENPWLIEKFSAPERRIKGILDHYLSCQSDHGIKTTLQLFLLCLMKYLGYASSRMCVK
jgi:rhamnosyltransferase